ncbi:MAG: homoserine dehydrogenase, partial [Micrococcales bacterium]|nr:homoserine dehydrogenase [Micrococcales bacterium]
MPLEEKAPLRVALLGCGVVGSSVARLLLANGVDLSARVGRRLELVGIAVRRTGRERPGLPPELFTTDAQELVTRADVVIEVIGGIEPARGLILRAFEHGASVVTAN